jgi:hypothetical protein
MSHFHRSCKIPQAFEDVGHIYFRLPSYSPFLNVAEWVFGHIKSHGIISKMIKHYYVTLTMMYKAIIAYTVQGWTREVDRSFARASCGERLGESYTWCTVLCEIKSYNSLNWFCEVVNMGTGSWSCSQHGARLVESSSSIGCLYSWTWFTIPMKLVQPIMFTSDIQVLNQLSCGTSLHSALAR